MLFDSTLKRDLARTFGATLVVILTIVITMMLIRTLGLAASDVVAPRDVVLVLGYTALGHLPTILSLSLFIAIVVTLGRMYRESEMAIWFACGLPLSRFVRPVLRTAWPVLMVIGLLLVFAWPWGNHNSRELRHRYEQRSDLSRVAPGVFQSSSDGRRVFFIERDGADGVNARNVFLLSVQEPVESVTSARAGHIEVEEDDRFLVLEDGQRSDVNARDGETTLAQFETYRVLADQRGLKKAAERPPKDMRTIDLLRQPTLKNQGELVWRFGLLMGAINMSLLAIGLANVNPRRPNNWNLVFALLTFVVYFNCINLSQTWVASGRIGMGVGLLLLHGSAFALALALLWWRDHATVLHLRPLRRRLSRTAA
jgi:lipopolysaccharide export system permease protein